MLAQLALGLPGIAIAAAVHVAIAIAARERDLPGPAVAQCGRYGRARNGLIHRRRQGHRRIVEEILRETDPGSVQRLVDQKTRKTAAVYEYVGGIALAFARSHRGNVALRIERRVGHVAALVAHPALERLLLQKLPEEYGIEVIAVPDVEREGV